MRSQENINRYTICALTVMVVLLVSLLSPVMAQEERVMIPEAGAQTYNSLK